MPISNVALTNTFDEWRGITNQIIVFNNNLMGDDLTTYRNMTANVVNANTYLINGLNLNSAFISSFNFANTANIYAFGAHRTANSAQVHANAAFLQANQVGGAVSTANGALVTVNGAMSSINTVFGGAITTVNGALNAANTNMVFKTGNTMTGNLVFSGANIVFVSATVNAGVYFSNTAFLRSPVLDVLSLGAGGVEGLRVVQTGNVGIGLSYAGTPYAGNVRAHLDVGGFYSTARANVVDQTLVDAATITWDGANGQIATVTLAGNRTLANITNPRIGTYILHVIQDGVGGRTLSFQRNYRFTANVTPTLTSAAGSRDIFTFVSDGTRMYGAFIPDVGG